MPLVGKVFGPDTCGELGLVPVGLAGPPDRRATSWLRAKDAGEFLERAPFMPPFSGLVGEFYQLVLAATYHGDGLWGEATFDVYARSMPEGYGYLVAAGLEPALQQIESLAFSPAEVELLRSQPVFSKIPATFFEALARLRFTGDVHAIAEGTPVFPGEPLLRITAPLLACTLLETRILQIVGHSTAVASRASRIAAAAGGRPVFDFGSRRAGGLESAFLAARAAYLGGAAGTTNAMAALGLGIPAFGTMSDTFLAAYGDDDLAYSAFRLHFPTLGHYSLPDDDPVDGVARFSSFKDKVSIVRVDHEELGRQSRTVREALNRNGLTRVKILGSGQLDETRIAKLVQSAAPIEFFAVGRAFCSGDASQLRLAFRIAEMQRGAGRLPVTRDGASSWPGRKQVVRLAEHDLVCIESEAATFGRLGAPLLAPVLVGGRRLGPAEGLGEIRGRRERMVALLPASLRSLPAVGAREVKISDALARLSLQS